MKNKFIFFVSIFFLYISEIDTSAVEDFIFESKSIEIENDGNIIAKDRVKVITSDGLEIFADAEPSFQLEQVTGEAVIEKDK